MTTLNRFTDQINELDLTRREVIQYGLVAAWMLAMISLPILKWTIGDSIRPQAVTFALLVQFTAVLYAVYQRWGFARSLWTLAGVAFVTWGMEWLGSHTGFPFGGYTYTDALQPQLGGVPLLIPLAWFMMLAPSWAVAALILGRHRRKVWGPAAFVGISALALTAWDLFLDPQMVEWGFWAWENPVGYFGIPWVNYAGWVLTAVVVTALVRPDRRELPVLPLLVIYGVVWFLQSIGLAVFWGQPGPAIVGAIVMGAFLALAIRGYVKRTHDAA